MKKTKTLFLTIVAACLLALPVLADEPQPALVVAGVPTVTLTADQFAQLVAKTAAGAPAPTPAKTSAISETSVFGISWATIGSILAAILGAVFMFWKGSVATRVQKALPDLMDAAYWFVERNFGDLDGPAKAMIAMGKLYEGMTGHGFVLDPKAIATAQTRWSLLAEKNKERQFEPPAPADLAKAQAAASAATAPGSAADLANQASR